MCCVGSVEYMYKWKYNEKVGIYVERSLMFRVKALRRRETYDKMINNNIWHLHSLSIHESQSYV